MFCDLGVIDELVTRALAAVDAAVAIYVPRGRPQPNETDNPNHLPWFRHKLKKSSVLKSLSAAEPDKAVVQVQLAVFAPGQLTVDDAYAMSTAMSTIAQLLYGVRLSDDPPGPLTHEVVFNAADEDQDFALGGEGGPAELVQHGLITVTGVAVRTA